jgi:hypothetical protein
MERLSAANEGNLTMTGLRILLLGSLLVFLGCEKDQKSRLYREASESPSGQDGLPQSKDGLPQNKAKVQDRAVFGSEQAANAQLPNARNGEVQQPEAQPRKIVYTATLELLVDDLDKVEQELTQLVAQENGYIAKSELHGSTGAPRWGQWTVRIPVDHYGAFKDAAVKLGEMRRATSDSDDITDRYYDLKAHLKNDQVEEEGLRKLLLEKSAGGKLEDILAVRRELRTVRGQIEQQQGQMQRWDKETALATITLNIHDRKDYVPPASPGLQASIGRTFEGSLSALQTFGRGLILTVVALAPWLPVLALVIVPSWVWLRRVRTKRETGVVQAP